MTVGYRTASFNIDLEKEECRNTIKTGVIVQSSPSVNPNDYSRTATVAIDISKAFDAVPHSLLIKEICETGLHPNLVHWLATYLRGRQSRVMWQGVLSPWRNVKTGVPQGSVLGPILFNFYVRDCPVSQPSYADDFNFSRSAVNIDEIERGLQEDLDKVVDWAKSKLLTIAPGKSSITLFTPDKARQANTHPQVTIEGTVIPLEKHPRISLGSTLMPTSISTRTSLRSRRNPVGRSGS